MKPDSNTPVDDEKGGRHGAYRIYRAHEYEPMKPASQRGVIRDDYVPDPVVAEGVKRFGQEGAGEGAMARVLFCSPTMHVSYAWFKSGFPLPLHSHDADCFYHIIAGSMQVGDQMLAKGDGIFIPAGVPYSATPGEEGVEFLEFRPTGNYDTRYRGKNPKYWDGIVDALQTRKGGWATEKPPYGLLE